MDTQTKPLRLTEREAITLFRSLIDHRNLLSNSRLALTDQSIVDSELAIVNELIERISLNHYYPEPIGGDGE